MRTKIFMLLCLISCDAKDADQTTGEYVVEMCGTSPLAPGRSYSFETVNGFERVLMTRETYAAIEQYVADAKRAGASAF